MLIRGKVVAPELYKRSRDLLQKLIVAQLVNKFPAFYGTQRFITTFIKSRYWSIF
jgi:hypothetical protein